MTSPQLTRGEDSTGPAPSYLIALARMAWDEDNATELGTLLEPSSFPDKASRDLFKMFATEVPKGASMTSLYTLIETHARHCLPLFREIEAEAGTDSVRDTVTNEYLAERVADEGKRVRLARQANQILTDITEGKPTADIIAHADMQRAAMDLASEKMSSRFLLRDDAEMESIPEIDWLIEGIVPDNATVTVVGPPGNFKSFLTVDWSYHIQLGVPWCGREVRRGDVVYLCGEGANGLRKRGAAWKAMNGVAGRLGVHFLTNALTLNDPSELAGVVKTIKSKGLSPRLIVIDTLARFMLGDENTAKDMGAFIRACDELRRTFSCTVVIVHHSGKDVGKGARGSSSLQGAVDTEVVCERPEGEMSLTLTCTKQKDGPTFRPIELEAVQIAGSLALKASIPGVENLGGKNLACLLAVYENDTGNGLTYSEWFDVANIKKPTFDKARNWLREHAYLSNARGRYSVNEAGRQALQYTRSTAGIPLVYSDPAGRYTRGGVYIDTPAVDQPSIQKLEASPEEEAA